MNWVRRPRSNPDLFARLTHGERPDATGKLPVICKTKSLQTVLYRCNMTPIRCPQVKRRKRSDAGF